MNTKGMVINASLLGLCLFILQACEQQATPVAETKSVESTATARMAVMVNDIADRYYETTLSTTPEVAYFSSAELERHDGMEDNSPAARKTVEQISDDLLTELEAVDAGELLGRTEWITHAYLLQQLKSQRGLRVCRNDLWNVNQMGGWHSAYSQIAQQQPVGTPELREQSLDRWGKLDAYADQEVENLKAGL